MYEIAYKSIYPGYFDVSSALKNINTILRHFIIKAFWKLIKVTKRLIYPICIPLSRNLDNLLSHQ